MNAFLIVIYILCGIYMLLNFKYDLQMLQQNSYRPERYWRWQKSRLWTGWRMTDIAMVFLLLSTLLHMNLALLLVTLVCMWKTVVIFRRKAKKPLVMTRRVWRLYSVTGVLAMAIYMAAITVFGGSGDLVGYYHGPCVAVAMMLLVTAFSWAIVIISVVILTPVEKAINKRYRDDAMRILRSMPDLKIIGITGSYGKTSTKNYLCSILSEQYETLMTPGSYNTPMGVIRTVREMMKPYTEVFICEMGAKQRGDIKEICDIVNPQCGIITAVGPMHLETFKSEENVCRTKFELADAVPAEGFVVVNNDFPLIASRKVDNCKCIRYGVSNPDGCDFIATDIEYSPEGTQFTMVDCLTEAQLRLRTSLVGECNISNLMAAVIMARRLGVSDEKIIRAVAGIAQVEHRLNMKRTPGGVTIIDDAFNSNPAGSRMALEVLGSMKGGRRIVVTLGMIELGDSQERLNEDLGRHIGENADIAVIVNEINREALVKGVKDTDFDTSNLHCCDSFAQAQQLLSGILKSGDTILYENDLPDTFK